MGRKLFVAVFGALWGIHRMGLQASWLARVFEWKDESGKLAAAPGTLHFTFFILQSSPPFFISLS